MSAMRQLPRLIINTLISAMGVLGTIYCFTTAFEIQVRFFPLMLCALFFGAVFSACFLWKRAFLVALPVLALGVFFLIRNGSFSPVGLLLQQMLHDVLTRFSSAYPNMSFSIPPEVPAMASRDFTLLFIPFAAGLSLWLSWGVGYRSCLITVAGTLPFLLLCVIINDTPPQVAPLVILLTVWLCVLLSKERPGEPSHMSAIRMVITAMSVLLVLTVVGAVYPKDDTSHQDLPELLQDIMDRLPGPMQNALSRESTGFLDQQLGADTSETLDLTQQGTRERQDTVMLQVSSTESGVLYLRGAAKDIYTGTAWESRNEATARDSVYAHTSLGIAYGESYQGVIEVKNLRDRADVAFTPYGFLSCAGADEITSDLRVTCPQDDYLMGFWPGVGTMDLTATDGVSSASYDQYVADTCLSLPEGLQARLYALAMSYGYDPTLDRVSTVAWVAEFVRTVGTYRLNVSRQPVNYDFAEYFLTESREGYCVHFATASAVMLRALGIPSRYASGYRVEVAEPGTVAEVTDQDTHAWAEAYFPGLGWIPIETTPGFGSSASLPEVSHINEKPDTQEAPTPQPSMEPDTPGQEPSEAPAEAPTPEPTPVPENPTAEALPEDDTAAPAGHSFPWLWLLSIPVLLLLGAAALFLRHQWTLASRQKRFTLGSRNQCMIEQWGYLEKLTAWGAEIPDGMEALAMKARFSQHEITLEELAGFAKVVRKLAKDTEGGLTRWQHLRYKWFSCLDLK